MSCWLYFCFGAGVCVKYVVDCVCGLGAYVWGVCVVDGRYVEDGVDFGWLL